MLLLTAILLLVAYSQPIFSEPETLYALARRASAETYCENARVRRDGVLVLNTSKGPTDDCALFLLEYSHFYQTVLLKGI